MESQLNTLIANYEMEIDEMFRVLLKEENYEETLLRQLDGEFHEEMGLEERKIRIVDNIIGLMSRSQNLDPSEPIRKMSKSWIILKHQIFILKKD